MLLCLPLRIIFVLCKVGVVNIGQYHSYRLGWIIFIAEECGARSVYVGPDPNPDDIVDSEAETTDDGESSLVQENSLSQKTLPLPLDALDPQQTYRTLCLILDCVHALDQTHLLYREHSTDCDELGSK